MMVEMGLDRLHHVFWHYCDPNHSKYEPGNKYENAFRDYYRMLDREVGEPSRSCRPTPSGSSCPTTGPGPGGVCFNDWFAGVPGAVGATHRPDGHRPGPIDWSRTTAWGDGGYYGRLFLNVKGREPQGIVVEVRGGSGRAGRQARGHARTGRLGPRHPGHQAPGRVPRGAGVAPDLIVYFGDLEWRSVGAMGMGEDGGWFAHENDTGPDGANHDRTGVFAMSGLPGQPTGKRDGMNLIDVGPTDEAVRAEPEGVQGRSIV